VLKDLLGTPEFRARAVEDTRLFRLEPFEIADLRAAIERVTAPDPMDRVQPFQPDRAAEPPATDLSGTASGPERPPYTERLDTPLADGGTPREALERFDPTRAGLRDISAREAADYIAANAESRPWLGPAIGHDPVVQRMIAAIDQGQGHFLERHGPFVDEDMLVRRVTRLEDPAQLDPVARANATDAFRDRVHACPDTATAFNDVVAFAAAFARAGEHPDLRRALDTPFDPDARPERVSIPLSDLLGPDGDRYVAGFRLEPVAEGLQAAWDQRAAWVEANRAPDREPDVPEALATPVRSFRRATVDFFFQANRERNGYEVSTMFVEPGPREADDD
jgi:hypothetical protein